MLIFFYLKKVKANKGKLIFYKNFTVKAVIFTTWQDYFKNLRKNI
jgi:hypothetical protein